MVRYQSLSSYQFGRDQATVEAEYQRRLNGYATYRTMLLPLLDGKQRAQVRRYPIFLVLITELVSLSGQMAEYSRQLRELARIMPESARQMVLNSLLLDESVHTNRIEGVQTNPAKLWGQIEQLTAAESAPSSPSMVQTYFNALRGQRHQLHDLADFRALYDQLLAGELDADHLPDGELFRATPVVIGNGLKVYHRPPRTEAAVQAALQELLPFMNYQSIPALYRGAITHFFFENTHPFLDGNGRMGRYLLASYLANKYDAFTGLSVSSAIYQQQDHYYKTFVRADAVDNRADLTGFTTALVGMIVAEQERVLARLTEAVATYLEAIQTIKTTVPETATDDLTYQVVERYVQSRLFNQERFMAIQDRELVRQLNEETGASQRQIRQTIERLAAAGVLEQVTARPKRHQILERYLVAED